MSPNNRGSLDELDSIAPESPTPQAERAGVAAPPATVRELTSTIADSHAVVDNIPLPLVGRLTSNPLPPPLPRQHAKPPRWSRRLTWLALAAGGVAVAIVGVRPAASPVLPRVGHQVLQEGERLRLNLAAVNRDMLPPLRYELVGPVPPRVKLAADTGELVWPTTEWDGPSEQTIRIRAAVAGQAHRAGEVTLKVTVLEIRQPPRFSPIPALTDLKLEDGIYHLQLQARDQDVPSGAVTYSFAAEPPLVGIASIDPQSGLFTWQPAPEEFGRSFELVFCAGRHSATMAETTLNVTLPDFGAPMDIGEGFSYRRFLTLVPDSGTAFEHIATKPHFGGTLRLHRYHDSLAMIVEYPNGQSARRALPAYLAHGDLLVPEFIEHEGDRRLYHKNRLIIVTIGDDPSLIKCMTKLMRPPQKVVAARGRVAAAGEVR